MYLLDLEETDVLLDKCLVPRKTNDLDTFISKSLRFEQKFVDA
jgi:hypothetical protein